MTMLRPYIKLLISEMTFKVLNIDFILIKARIIDGRRLILHYIGIFSFFMVAILKPSTMAGRTQDIEC